jgi:hypothetical protein
LESPLDFVALRAFLIAHVENYEQLEALRLLCRSKVGLTAADVASALKLETLEAQQVLERLARSKLAERAAVGADDVFRYSPGTPELSSNVQLLLIAYDEDRVRLVELMTANAIERMRTTALRAFADGFRFGGRKKDG